MGVLGKYLAALAVSFEPGSEQQQQDTARERKSGKTSSKRKRLHVLYLLNDLLHHTKYHGHNPSAFSTLSGAMQSFLVELFDLAAGYDREKNPKHYKRLNDLLDIWGGNGYYSADYIHKLRQTVENASTLEAINAKSAIKDDVFVSDKKSTPKDPPFVMPATHGDTSSPWHELPAGNLMPLIVPNSSTPIRSLSVKPLQFLAGPADETLVKAVKGLLKEVDRIYSSGSSITEVETIVDIDELGQTVTRDETTGELVKADGYYGWSRSFCQKMKERMDGKARSRSGSRSRSRSQSSSISPQKRRRYSDSSGDEEDRYRSRSVDSSRNRMQRRRYSISRSRSRSPRRPQSRPRSPPRAPSSQNAQHPPPYNTRPPPPMQYPYQGTPQSNLPQQATPPLGMFSAPPRPPNYHGPWPPAPPPIPPHVSTGPTLPPNMGVNVDMGMNMGMGMMNMNMNMPGYGAPFPPFPPPPPPQPPHGPSHAHPYPGAYPPHAPHMTRGNPQPYNPGGGQGGGRGGYGGGRGGWNQGGWS